MRNLIFIVVLTLLWNCDGNKNPLSPDANNLAFVIYFLQDETLKMKDVNNQDINKLKLVQKTWLYDKDIRFYDWSSHCIYLKKDKTHFFPKWENYKFTEFPPEWTDKPFVVVVNVKRCCKDYFSCI